MKFCTLSLELLLDGNTVEEHSRLSGCLLFPALHSRVSRRPRSYKELEKALGEQAKFEQAAAKELQAEEELIAAKKKDWLLALCARHRVQRCRKWLRFRSA